mmetsp:Transcript_22868/g.26109  ORF Transcript_22868/g.26109 Transcript_22868/m.26109 type:complete len:256 (+) Transcript_22868:55-822(+)
MASTITANFLPGLLWTNKVRILDAEEVFATNDSCCHDFDKRHLIDRDYLASIDVGNETGVADGRLVDPTPPCNSIFGTKSTTDTIVGMIRKRLKVSIFVGDRSGWVQYKLQNVLVVDSLPLPLHISWQALDLEPDRINTKDKRLTALQPRLTSSIVPPQFRSHPYWGRNDMNVMGSLFSEGIERTDELVQEIQENTTGRPNRAKRGKACATCGIVSENIMLCSRCKDESYCSRNCQKKRWRIHKNVCQPPNTNSL